MIVAQTITCARKILTAVRAKKKSIGFVPTMGALHQGHLSLVNAARKENDFVAVSIFVNPAQFGTGEDFRKYPRTFLHDKGLLVKNKVDLLFHPIAGEMYPQGFSTFVDNTRLSNVLCGVSRPGHFRGVSTVVAKLFNIIGPDTAYFGAKDFQQAQIIKRMVKDMDMFVKIKVLPIIREADGLAMSSRNVYLTKPQRAQALSLSYALSVAQSAIIKGVRDPVQIIKLIKAIINSHNDTRIDYIEIMNADDLSCLKLIRGKILIALAVFVGTTRLIDNVTLNVKD